MYLNNYILYYILHLSFISSIQNRAAGVQVLQQWPRTAEIRALAWDSSSAEAELQYGVHPSI